MALNISNSKKATVELTVDDILQLLHEKYPQQFTGKESVYARVEVPSHDPNPFAIQTTSHTIDNTYKITLSITSGE